MNPNRYDIWDVSHAAARLTTQASTLAALHLNDGTARLRFGYEVARYAKCITDAVSLGPEIQTFLKYGSAAIGVGQSIFSSQVKGVGTVLTEIEALHQSSFKRDGHLRSAQFFKERQQLFRRLDAQLTSLIKTGVGFPDHPDIKTALGISSRSLVHHWTQAGAPGQIPGYATHLENVAKASRYLKYGGWIGTAIGGGASYLKVQEVCAAGNTEACEKVRFTETGGFVGGVAGGAAAGAGFTWACGLLAPPTAGAAVLACAIILVGGGSFAGSYGGGKMGEYFGELIYKVVR